MEGWSAMFVYEDVLMLKLLVYLVIVPPWECIGLYVLMHWISNSFRVTVGHFNYGYIVSDKRYINGDVNLSISLSVSPSLFSLCSLSIILPPPFEPSNGHILITSHEAVDACVLMFMDEHFSLGVLWEGISSTIDLNAQPTDWYQERVWWGVFSLFVYPLIPYSVVMSLSAASMTQNQWWDYICTQNWVLTLVPRHISTPPPLDGTFT